MATGASLEGRPAGRWRTPRRRSAKRGAEPWGVQETTPLGPTYRYRWLCSAHSRATRAELAALLEAAMDALPAHTREILALLLVAERSHAEIAGRMGLSTDAVAMRVQRGKEHLRRILLRRFPEDALAHGLVASDPPGWEQPHLVPGMRRAAPMGALGWPGASRGSSAGAAGAGPA